MATIANLKPDRRKASEDGQYYYQNRTALHRKILTPVLSTTARNRMEC